MFFFRFFLLKKQKTKKNSTLNFLFNTSLTPINSLLGMESLAIICCCYYYTCIVSSGPSVFGLLTLLALIGCFYLLAYIHCFSENEISVFVSSLVRIVVFAYQVCGTWSPYPKTPNTCSPILVSVDRSSA